ncbi:M56 family metallopeptidase [Nocardia sp. NPDC051990]|uniref:M56 family metallopeptidase n=1 Tax=Nocardia sp. NPDC051990 TaxID=3155285 RepID=UPI00343EB1AE
MNVAVSLMIYGSMVATFGPTVLRRLTWRGVAPRLGVLAWLVAIAGALGAWAIASGMLIVEFATYWHPADMLHDCYAALATPIRLHDGLLVQLGTLASAALVAAALLGILTHVTRAMLQMRRRTIAHARAVRMVGRHVPGIGAVVLDSPERQAYCVAGPPDTIVVTSAAVDALTEQQLAAVLAHEHAHLSERHAGLLRFLRGIAIALPGMRLVTDGEQEIGRLLEMCADDTAARRHGREPLLEGLLAIVGATEPLPAGALSAAATAVLVRAERLVAPVGVVRRATNWTALLAVMAATVVGLLEIAVGVLFCSTVLG